MISKNDCYLLLSELESNGVDISTPLEILVNGTAPIKNVIQFINNHRQLDLNRFYEKLRKKYNNKKSTLYINIMKEIENPNDVLITLSSMLTQIFIFSKDVEDKQMFFRHARVDEILKVLLNYNINADLKDCIKLIKLIKLDIKALEESMPDKK